MSERPFIFFTLRSTERIFKANLEPLYGFSRQSQNGHDPAIFVLIQSDRSVCDSYL